MKPTLESSLALWHVWTVASHDTGAARHREGFKIGKDGGSAAGGLPILVLECVDVVYQLCPCISLAVIRWEELCVARSPLHN